MNHAVFFGLKCRCGDAYLVDDTMGKTVLSMEQLQERLLAHHPESLAAYMRHHAHERLVVLAVAQRTLPCHVFLSDRERGALS